MTRINTAIGAESPDARLARLGRRLDVAIDRLNNAADALESAEREYDDAKAAYESADHEYQLALNAWNAS